MSYTFLYLPEVLGTRPSDHMANLSSISTSVHMHTTHTHTHTHTTLAHSHKKWHQLQFYYCYRVKLFFSLFFFCHTHSICKFPGQGLNPSHGYNLHLVAISIVLTFVHLFQ